jgi:hypothetical protein
MVYCALPPEIDVNSPLPCLNKNWSCVAAVGYVKG